MVHLRHRTGQDERGQLKETQLPVPLTPVPPGARWHPQLYPPVMVAASRRVPVSDRWDTGPVRGQAVTDESGMGWTGGLWLGRVSRGTGVSSLAGVTWGPGCHGERHRPPGLPGAALAGSRVPSPAPAWGKGAVQVMLEGSRDTS